MTSPPPEHATKSSGVPSSYISALIILAAVVGYFGLGTLFGGDDAPADDGAENDRQQFSVLVSPAQTENRPITVRVNARTEAGSQIVVRAETPGQIAAIPVEEGDFIEEGGVLCQLDTDSRLAVLAEAEAGVRQAETDFDGTQQLFDAGFASEAALRAATAARDGARARLTQARQDLSNVRITAPFSGVVSDLHAEQGDVLSSGGACASLVDLNRIIVTGGVPARLAALVTQGDKAQIAVDGHGIVEGTVVFVSEVADPRTRAFRVEMLTDTNDGITDGLNASADIIAGQQQMTHIPRSALVYSDDGLLGVRSVQTMSGDEESDAGLVAFLPITLNSEDQQGAFVTGIPGGTNIIIRGQNYVGEGTTVTFSQSDESEL